MSSSKGQNLVLAKDAVETLWKAQLPDAGKSEASPSKRKSRSAPGQNA
jgi:hypothetical protein